MRISLLQQREPFGSILEQTLSSFIEETLHQSSTVRWHEHQRQAHAQSQGEQLWLCNIYLNAIFVPAADRRIFAPIRHEFARSTSAWRRQPQRAYVSLALSHMGAPRMAQASVSITPGLPGAEQLLIIPGNHKIRILDYKTRTVYVILKSGFAPEFIRQEIETRRLAEHFGLPVPALEYVSQDGAWFKERYVSGTPVNRLADQAVAHKAVKDAGAAVGVLVNATLCEELLDEYVERTAGCARSLIAANQLLTAEQRQSLLQSVDRLVAQIAVLRPATGGRIFTATTHGDFQPANILLNHDGTWLIDWEYSARRQSGYDALVFALGARAMDGLAQRIQTLLRADTDEPWQLLNTWPSLSWHSRPVRYVYLTLFLLEELVLHLQENANSLFRRPGQGLLSLERELWPALQAVSA